MQRHLGFNQSHELTHAVGNYGQYAWALHQDPCPCHPPCAPASTLGSEMHAEKSVGVPTVSLGVITTAHQAENRQHKEHGTASTHLSSKTKQCYAIMLDLGNAHGCLRLPLPAEVVQLCFMLVCALPEE